MMTPAEISRRIAVIKRSMYWPETEGASQRAILYSDVLKEIARTDCIDPRSLAREALKLEGYKADAHE
jgi:hypothetical protein